MTPLASLPLHPLFVHGAVVFIPLAALAAMVFALVPRWRWITRWPTAVLQLLAGGFLVLSRWTGDPLAESIKNAGATDAHMQAVHHHEQLANLLTVATLPLCVLTLLACWAFASASPLPSGRGARRARLAQLHLPLTVLLLISAAATLVFVVLAGDAGARAVWTA